MPLVDARSADQTARRAALAASASGDAASAARLLRAAIDALDTDASDAGHLRAALLVDLGECHSALDDTLGAESAFDEAAATAARSGDAEVRALAECGGCRHLNPFIDHPVRRQRLADAERALPPGDHPGRVALLGRLAVAGAARADLR